MSTIKVVDVLAQATYMLTDAGAVRWPNDNLLTWFNEAQLALVARRPDSLATNESFVCVAGAKQTLPATALRLIDIIRTVGGSAITKVARTLLDSHIRDWYTRPESAVIEHYVYDDRDPKHFYLYPPALVSTPIEIIYSTAPAAVVIANFATDTQVIDVDDTFANALQEYILYKAWMKDAEHAGNVNRASLHYQQFLQAIGDITQADTAMAPKDG